MKRMLLSLFFLIYTIGLSAGYYTKGDYIYVINPDHLDEIIQTVSNGDRETFSKMVAALQAIGIGGFLPAGRQVYITGRDWGTVQFYFSGETQRYWTLKEAIEYRK